VPTILVAQAQFDETVDQTGERVITPGPAKLTIAVRRSGVWSAEVVEDPESNVFHKAMSFLPPGEPWGIATIGGNSAPAPALLKLWRREGTGWTSTVLSAATFGGRFNRFRDMEAGDVTGDGVPELVIATHDAGVVAVVARKDDGGWSTEVIDSTPSTFVHEIELGDLDGDGGVEIYATPTAPNRLDRGLQPGRIVHYSRTSSGWSALPVEIFSDRHAKEIAVADVDGDGRQELLAAVERPRVADEHGPHDVEIVRFDRSVDGWDSRRVATVTATTCRSIVVGEIDGDPQKEVVVGCGRTGLWLLEPGQDRWAVRRFDPRATSVETAVALGDLDRDGISEVYVAADDSRRVIQYRARGTGFDRTELFEIAGNAMTFNIEAGLRDFVGELR
jgi:hypothetical protein